MASLDVAAGAELDRIALGLGLVRFVGDTDDLLRRCVREAVEIQAEQSRRTTTANRLSPNEKSTPSTPRTPTPAEIREENKRVGAELAKNPPAWAYPLGWTLAVSAAVEIANNRPDPEPGVVDGNPFGSWLVLVLRRYHDARLAGQTPRKATETATGGPEWHEEPPGLICAAYERGRGAPGEGRIGRPG